MTLVSEHPLPVAVAGKTLGAFLALSFVLCVAFGLLLPEVGMHKLLSALPGFEWLTWRGVLFGLIWTQVFAWYTALLFGFLFNTFSARHAARRPS